MIPAGNHEGRRQNVLSDMSALKEQFGFRGQYGRLESRSCVFFAVLVGNSIAMI